MTLTITRTATVNLTANEWQLYSESMNCTRAAAALNAAAAEAINRSTTAAEAMKCFYPAMNKWADYGAADSEPYYVASDLFTRAFGA